MQSLLLRLLGLLLREEFQADLEALDLRFDGVRPLVPKLHLMVLPSHPPLRFLLHPIHLLLHLLAQLLHLLLVLLLLLA